MYVIKEKDFKGQRGEYIVWATPFAGLSMSTTTKDIDEARKFESMVDAYKYIEKNQMNRKLYQVVGDKNV